MESQVLMLSAISVLLILSIVFLCLFLSRHRRTKNLQMELDNITEQYHKAEFTFKEHEQSLLNQLRAINSTIESIENKCANIINQNNALTEQLKQKNIELKSTEHRMSKLQRESEGYDVAMFIEWLNGNKINTEQARNMVNESIDMEEELARVKAKYEKLANDKRLLENYSQAVVNQLQILLKK